ncbi:MAG: hypothetical protein MJ156_01855 [Alphaproteobacteria bacterium]|nr:hypothetical protein [Alphaproteobacteria bacterium]
MITYNPITGMTIEEAFVKACNEAKTKNDLVHVIINDFHFFLTPKAESSKYIKLYRKHLEQKYKHISQKVR